MTRLAPILISVLVFLPSCGNDKSTPPKQATPARPHQDNNSGSAEGGIGSERDPSRNATFGTMVTTKDSYILRRQTDYKNYARAVLCPTPKRGDLDTYNVRVREGRYIPIPAGTKVTRRGVSTFPYEGVTYRFIRIEVADGSIADESGMGQRGNVPEDAFK